MSVSDTAPVSRYRSSTSSSQTAVSSQKSPDWVVKSTTPPLRRAFRSFSRASWSAPARSILLTNRKVGMWYRSSSRHSVRVWPWTPSVPLMTSTAQSSTWRVRSISAEKSTWPGVSSSVTWWSGRSKTACLEKMVMPRSRSMASVSRKASRWSTRPSFRSAPQRYSMASDRVVFPASTWAMTPIQTRFISQTTFMKAP